MNFMKMHSSQGTNSWLLCLGQSHGSRRPGVRLKSQVGERTTGPGIGVQAGGEEVPLSSRVKWRLGLLSTRVCLAVCPCETVGPVRQESRLLFPLDAATSSGVAGRWAPVPARQGRERWRGDQSDVTAPLSESALPLAASLGENASAEPVVNNLGADESVTGF